ncbi:MAG: IS66 family insertion sequence element accessory protein TnpA [Methylocella sp.]
MRLKHFQNKARRSYWSVHFEAWRRSGVSRAEYCRRHNLNECTFVRWLKVLDTLESVRNKAREWRKWTHEPVSRNKQNKAVQAFWAMHVEAMNWSGVNAKDYAAAHHISIYTLRTWRSRLDADPLRIDWRASLHPSVRAKISSDVSSAAKDGAAKEALTDVAKSDPPRDR